MISEDDYYHERPSYELPISALEQQPITSDDYMNCTPEKLELVGGFLVSKAEDNYWRVGEARPPEASPSICPAQESRFAQGGSDGSKGVVGTGTISGVWE